MKTTLDIIMIAHAARQQGKLLWVHDAAHEWLIVSDDDLAELSLKDSDFSEYSYRQHEWRALEGDCDAAIYIERLKANGGNADNIAIVPVGESAALRSWPRMN